ncbi:amidohydrolase [Desulfitibacter alkalitolerans]|uniref:amidohydrolase n=1 Tax=Desulfitibacter alkalitolerans TaxID=264641 RepID=UPI0005516309|nr:amidohydrolase [Desulfitibacter alkalitolerans]
MNKVGNLFAPDLVFINGNIITLDSMKPTAEAIAVKKGRIVKIGSNSHITSLIQTATNVIDLKGKTLIPGFIESHTHLIMYGDTLSQINCRTPPNKSISNILEKIKEETAKKPPGEWIKGWGYDDTLLEEKRHPNRWDLDMVSPNHPVYITHVSGHLAVVNSYALRLARIDKSTSDPVGGIIYRTEGSQEPNGILAEPPAMDKVTKLMPKATVQSLKKAISIANDKYLSVGVTSIHEAGVGLFFGRNELTAYIEASMESILKLHAYLMIYYSLFEEMIDNVSGNLGISTGSEFGKIKIGSIKTLQDGSIQGITAALQQPYYCDPNYMGGLILSQDKLEQIVEAAYSKGFQLSVHGNGDACIESILQAYEKVLGENKKSNHRFRIEHCQTVTNKQLDRIKKMGITISFFPVHTYYWGDRHKNIFLGPERAERIDPLKSALDRGILFGMHNDCPITEINPLMSIYSAVNRLTKDGHVLGEHERISVEQALKAMTINSAYLAFEENLKGTLTPGKLADMVVLDQNPLTVHPEKLNRIQVEMTVVEGEIVFRR